MWTCVWVFLRVYGMSHVPALRVADRAAEIWIWCVAAEGSATSVRPKIIACKRSGGMYGCSKSRVIVHNVKLWHGKEPI